MPRNTPSPDLIERFVEIVGAANAWTRAEDQARYLTEWRDRYRGATPVVLRPATPDEVSRILALANEANVGVVPQAGNTGLVGGQIPSLSGDEIVVSVERMTAIRDLDADGGTLTVEAGVTLADVQAIAEGAGRLFPLSLASEGSARVGGILATNAGGTAVLAYGNARQLTLGLEAVLADGRIWHGLRQLKKDNTGYDLRDLLIGSEGTLGIITAATLRLHPRPAETATAVVALRDPVAILTLFRLAEQTAGGAMTAFEFWSDAMQRFAVSFMPGVRVPMQVAAPWYVLIEVSGGVANGRAGADLEALLASACDAGVVIDAVIAATVAQSRDAWQLRESFSEAQKGAGGSIKHDISLPVARVPDFLERAGAVVEQVCPGARPVPFGHFGDGNVHYNVSQPDGMDKAEYLAMWEPMSSAIHDLVASMNGSISAEHGIGQMKRADLARYQDPVALDMMRAIKTALDPKGILNPGKLL